ncbi:MAG: ATP-binding protein [Terriglobia bacterium]
MAKPHAARRHSSSNPPEETVLERTLAATPEAAERALEDVLAHIRNSKANCGDLDEIRLALREALNNAVCHGSRLNPNQQVHLVCRCHPRQGLTLVVRDEGPGFDPDTIPDPTADANLERFGGRGLFIIRQLMDEVVHQDRGRELRMHRRPRS